MAGIKTIASRLGNKNKKSNNPFDNGLEKLTLVGYKKDTYTGDKTGTFVSQFNPQKFDESFTVEYTDEKTQNTISDVKKFKNVPSKELTINLTLDATGASGQVGNKGTKGKFGLTADSVSIPDEIKLFKEATGNFIGDTHDIPYCHITWGPNEFKGRLKSLKITHTLFKADGTPLRSLIEATFSSSKDLVTQQKEKDTQSPDLTHIRTVKVGDTLPLMCQAIYNDSSQYIKVARFNNLVDFRNLEPGSEIIFPPII